MKRREFIAGLGGTAAIWPLVASAQQAAKVPRIGIIDNAPIWEHFRQGLRESGYIEGRNIAFEYRIAGGNTERLAAAAADLARLPVDVIATYGTPATRAAKLATTTIPIVMISVGDPVRTGLVTSFARPGGNVTGITILSPTRLPSASNSSKRLCPRYLAWLSYGTGTMPPTRPNSKRCKEQRQSWGCGCWPSPRAGPMNWTAPSPPSQATVRMRS